ncbi:DUF4252 domain-containing protein [Tenacibaculum sp. 190524A02b]|uniref:DUF4252 domain-containing protein n=1 Tax=Tenacibaculum vairaonense TaxID=3137860 RepID=A0ABM9PGI7_9FLAO
MKKLYKYILLLTIVLTVSCKKESVQSYIVESKEKQEFLSLDVPKDIIQLKLDNASDEDKEAYNSLRKVNLVMLPYKNTDEATYQSEKKKIKEILNKSSYTRLLNLKKDGMNVVVYYSGEAEAIDEIVALGYGKNIGVGLARVLGDNMNPSRIMNMMKNADIGTDKIDLSQFKMVLDSKNQ